jgi:hypothetical protein
LHKHRSVLFHDLFFFDRFVLVSHSCTGHKVAAMAFFGPIGKSQSRSFVRTGQHNKSHMIHFWRSLCVFSVLELLHMGSSNYDEFRVNVKRLVYFPALCDASNRLVCYKDARPAPEGYIIINVYVTRATYRKHNPNKSVSGSIFLSL